MNIECHRVNTYTATKEARENEITIIEETLQNNDKELSTRHLNPRTSTGGKRYTIPQGKMGHIYIQQERNKENNNTF
jgi:hypothetical protein